MRKESSNQFTEGLMSDLNPINTPNTVLTDNLNGTIITYNGNEFSLQNDMGNYELKHCKLNPNFIPVGLKEYGDILYVASYNPLTKEFEVGSYPSPLMISESTDYNNDKPQTLNSIIQTELIDVNKKEESYTKLMEKANSIFFNGENYKLNPGDQYCLQQDVTSLRRYETVDYYILGEDAIPHNINHIIKTDDINTDPDYNYVPWTTPGWVNLKVRLAELSNSGINVRSFYVPKTPNGTNRVAKFSLNLRLNVDDPILKEKDENGRSILEKWCDNELKEVGYRIQILVNESLQYSGDILLHESGDRDLLDIGDFEWSDWYEDSRILWKNIKGQIKGLNDGSVVTIKVIPFIETDGHKILYDNTKQLLTFNLNDIDNTSWEIGNELYQFYIGDEGESMIVYTNMNGPLLTSYEPKLKCEIFNITNNSKPIFKSNLIEYKGIGENVFEFKFNRDFKKESGYVIRFTINDGCEDVYTADLPIITSAIFNNYIDRLIYYKDISFDEWVSAYRSLVKYETEIITFDNPNKKPEWFSDSIDKNNRYWAGGNYNTFFPHDNPGLKSFTIDKGLRFYKNLIIEYGKSKDYVENLLTTDLGRVFLKHKISHQYKDYKTNKWIDLSESKNETIYLNSFIRTHFDYNKTNMPFEFVKDLDVWNFTDSVGKLNHSLSVGDYKLYDNNVSINITVCGRKSDSKKSFIVEGKFNDNNYYHMFESEVSDKKLIEEDVHNYSIRAWLSDMLTLYSAPCLMVNVTYTLIGESNNFKLYQLLYGAAHDGDFEFKMEEDGYTSRCYLALPGKNCAVLVPFAPGTRDTNTFEHFCEAFSYVKQGSGWMTYDRYLLKEKSIEEFFSRLTIKQDIQFDNISFSYLNKWSDLSKMEIFKSHNSLQNSIESIIYDVTLEKEFDKENYPYVGESDYYGVFHEGMQDINNDITKLNSRSESEFNEWFNDPIYLERRSNPVGVYCKYITGDNLFIKDFAKVFTTNTLPTHRYDESERPKRREAAPQLKNVYSEKDRAAWLIGHDWVDNLGKDMYVDLGGCWAGDSTLVLSEKWDWIYGL